MTTPEPAATPSPIGVLGPIGILGMGAMGAGVARTLSDAGHQVVTALDGRSERTQARAADAGAQDHGTLARLVETCTTFISLVPADQAEPLGERIAQALRNRTAPSPFTYIDANSMVPTRTARVAATVQAAGATFIDGGIIGPPPSASATPRLYLSGPGREAYAALQTPQLTVTLLGESLTQATELKILYASYNKGAVALMSTIMAAVQRADLMEEFLNEATHSPSLAASTLGQAPGVGAKAARWAIEMRDCAAALEDLEQTGAFHEAAARVYEDLAATLGEKGQEAQTAEALFEAWRKREL
ncbi:MAG: NAD(P)-binding domain-containing protein [Pseudomonadota bacterium]